MADELKKYDDNRKFKYVELKGRHNCPTGIDVTRKEVSEIIKLLPLIYPGLVSLVLVLPNRR